MPASPTSLKLASKTRQGFEGYFALFHAYLSTQSEYLSCTHVILQELVYRYGTVSSKAHQVLTTIPQLFPIAIASSQLLINQISQRRFGLSGSV